jgi:hypothetical protein
MKTYRRHKPAPFRERIERYVDAVSPAIAGQWGHRQTFLVAVALVRGFDLSPQRALPFLERYNQRCEPKWSTAELEYKLQSADQWQPTRKTLPARGYLF